MNFGARMFHINVDLYMKLFDGRLEISVVGLRLDILYLECSEIGLRSLRILNTSMHEAMVSV